MRSRSLLTILCLSVLLGAQIACRAASQGFSGPTQPAQVVETATPAAEQAATPLSPATPTAELAPDAPTAPPPDPEPGEIPPQSQAAAIQPPESRVALTRLSTLLNFALLDRDGAPLGTVTDYIINTCETYIIHMVVEPAAGLGFPAGERLFIPFEGVTINSGVLDSQANAIQLELTPAQVAGAPSFPAQFALTPTDWEEQVRTFWSERLRLSNLTTGCNVASGTRVYKVAYASELLGVPLKDGLQTLLGSVEEGILEPESGKLQFLVIRLQDSQALVMTPLGFVNIPKEALAPGATLELVLLSKSERLLDAPRIDSIEQASDPAVQNNVRAYWQN